MSLISTSETGTTAYDTLKPQIRNSAGTVLATLAILPASVQGGENGTGTVSLDRAAPAGGTTVSLSSSAPGVASVPASVVVPAGATSARFVVTTYATKKNRVPTVSATLGGVTRTFDLVIKRR